MTVTFSTIAIQGDESKPPLLANFDTLYQDHAGSVHRFCVSQAGDRALAEDLTHETFLKAFHAYQRVRPDPATVRTWLLTIARNVSTDHHRRRGRWQRVLSTLHRTQPPSRDIETDAQFRTELERVNAVVATLRARDRQLIGLRVAADLSYREMGEILGISEQVAKVATFRALTKLRALLEKDS